MERLFEHPIYVEQYTQFILSILVIRLTQLRHFIYMKQCTRSLQVTIAAVQTTRLLSISLPPLCLGLRKQTVSSLVAVWVCRYPLKAIY